MAASIGEMTNAARSNVVNCFVSAQRPFAAIYRCSGKPARNAESPYPRRLANTKVNKRLPISMQFAMRLAAKKFHLCGN
ncbi:MAG: hypothetical protein WCA56_06980 [Xanthobacteraceae bacterium]